MLRRYGGMNIVAKDVPVQVVLEVESDTNPLIRMSTLGRAGFSCYLLISMKSLERKYSSIVFPPAIMRVATGWVRYDRLRQIPVKAPR